MFDLNDLKSKNWFVKFSQALLNVSLVILGLILSYCLVRELYFIIRGVILGNNVHSVLENVLVFFLYFVFISMIVKYFCENYHFPLRYLIYVGITGSIRFILVNHENALDNFIFSLAILALVISYILLTPGLKRTHEERESNDQKP
ncbi:phosphate-starvation-inducible protein PsiE [Paenibacillus caui]|uniref:phosphate-starvation-inducible protein PsiE n=1 Tax=Paenibacillus caui TaxID=2873927 RepID=UPI001CA8639E|nr:phosphate-starvation-inducible protein PsiE [Paenibacillus caui]